MGRAPAEAAWRNATPSRPHRLQTYQGRGAQVGLWLEQASSWSKHLKGPLNADSHGTASYGWAGGAGQLGADISMVG